MKDTNVDNNANTLEELKTLYVENNCQLPENSEDTKCNTFLLRREFMEREYLNGHPEESRFLYPNLNDPLFNIKIAEKKEFNDTKYDGEIHDIKTQSDILSKAEFELSPHQAFVRNFLSFQTPYNGLLLFHGLGSGKTCSAIGVCEEMRDYLKQMGISKRIIIVASPNVQDNFRSQLFDERKLKLIDGLWNIRSCTGNKLLKEINPMAMRGLSKEKVISQIKNIINSSYIFLGYIEFSNYIANTAHVKSEYRGEKDKRKKMIRNLQYEFNNRMIVIDEVHNIRITDDNENKKVAEQLMLLVSSADNLRLLLLSATPMYNSYKEIVWLLNLMNVNDRRAMIKTKDVFDANGDFKVNLGGEEVGKDLLIRKATGYISFVRGDNPYTFPFRVYPSIFSPENTFQGSTTPYPIYQMNGKKIDYLSRDQVLSVYLTRIGPYQMMGYKFIIDSLRKKKITITTNKGVVRDMPSFDNMDSFGYTLLQIPLEALNIVYPIDELEEAVENITPISRFSEISESGTELKSVQSESLIELRPVPSNEPSVSSIEYEPIVKEGVREGVREGGANISSSKSNKSSSEEQNIYINANDITGHRGLERIMTFVDSKKPPEKGSFEYKDTAIKKGWNIFSPDKIGQYSAKIKKICDAISKEVDGKIVAADGVILIYSQYIDGGLIPIALALEEMGFTRYTSSGAGGGKIGSAKSLFKKPPHPPVDSTTMLPRKDKNDTFHPARYVMITGDPRISPNNDFEVKALTSDNNKDGQQVKIALISKAGSEGLDFKFIRQVHILEPWYTTNRIEQIIGRAVRNFSHKDLPFEKRNVQIYMYGTLLDDNEEEAADLYVYRVAEYKAIQTGMVTRILKETAVDCMINHDQMNFTQENMKTEVKQILSDGLIVPDFKVGDAPYSSACDYMSKCEYKCSGKGDGKLVINEDTYSEPFIMMNSDKILQKIRMLMKERFFYKKPELIRRINIPKQYPTVQIYAALTQLVEDSNEFISDKYERTGYLVNVGEYYFFQPSELNDWSIPIFERSIPIDYKHDKIVIKLKPVASADVVAAIAPIKRTIHKTDTDTVIEVSSIKETDVKRYEILEKGLKIMEDLRGNYELAIHVLDNIDEVIPRGDDDWYKHCGVTMRKLIFNNTLTREHAVELLVEHLVDMLLYHQKLDLLRYIYLKEDINGLLEKGVKTYLQSKIVNVKNLQGIILYSLDKIKIYLLVDNTKWIDADPEDEREILEAVAKNVVKNKKYNKLLGFIGFDNKNRYLVFKVKDTMAKRNTGARCDESAKSKKILLLNEILGEEKYTKENTKGIVQSEMCSTQEFILRHYNKERKNGQIWFLDYESTMLHGL